jgi:NADH:ubiquinone oxidoreductase subunit E
MPDLLRTEELAPVLERLHTRQEEQGYVDAEFLREVASELPGIARPAL